MALHPLNLLHKGLVGISSGRAKGHVTRAVVARQAATLKNKNELEWNEEFEVQCGVRRVGLQIIPAQGHDREGLCFGWTNLSQDDLSWLTTRLGPQKIRLKGFDLQRPPHLWVEVKVDSARY